MIIFSVIFFIVLGSLIIKDIRKTEERQNNPKFFPTNIVYHSLSNSIFKITRQATQEEIRKNYPSFLHRPYSAYWVKIIKLGQTNPFNPIWSANEDITLVPLAESSLIKIKKEE